MQQKNTIICLLTQIWSACTDIIFCHFRPFFALLRHYWPQKLKFAINAKKALEILSFYTCVPLIKIIWCIVPVVWSSTDRIFLVILGNFLLFYPLTTWKIKIKNEKNPEDIIILSKCNKNHNHLLYTVPEIWHMTDVIIFILGIRHFSKHFSTTGKRS